MRDGTGHESRRVEGVRFDLGRAVGTVALGRAACRAPGLQVRRRSVLLAVCARVTRILRLRGFPCGFRSGGCGKDGDAFAGRRPRFGAFPD
ncbi:MAG TPA: hypothetical protein DIC34_15670 [Treponema sp.]|nr:hypothetical protein [Treponema sp.]